MCVCVCVCLCVCVYVCVNTYLSADDRPPVLNVISTFKPGIYVFLLVMMTLSSAYVLFFLVFQIAFRNRK